MKKQLVTLLIIFSIILSFSIPVGATTERKSVIVVFKNAPDAGLIRAHGGDIKYQYDIIPGIAVNMPVTALKGLQKHPNIAYIEEDCQVHALGDTLPWGVDRIDAELVWGDSDSGSDIIENGNAGDGVKVAIIDTGIDYDHTDLADNYMGGYDFVNDDIYPMDDHGHGTHCAGIVAAENNGIGVIGVAPEAHLYGVKVLDNTGSGYSSDVIAGIEWSVDNGMQIISMSLGGDTGTLALEHACNNASNAGVLIVAAAGNDGNPAGKGDTVDYPARYDSVIAVVATDNTDQRARWSSTGPAVEISAPGVSILSTYPGNRLATMSGTSMACPHVTGTVALIMASDPSLSNAEVRQILSDTADNLGDPYKYGSGIVDADEAAPSDTIIPDDTSPIAIYYVAASDITDTSATITWTTNEVSDSEVNYGKSTALGSTVSNSTMVISHSVTLTGLEPGNTYYYEVNSTDSSGNTATDDNNSEYHTFTTTTSDTPSPGNEMHIANISMSTGNKSAGPNVFTWALATVTVVNSSGSPVSGAEVTGTWSNLTSDSDTATTGTEGEVTVCSDSVKNLASGTFTFTVTGVYLADWTYNATANPVDSGSIIVP